MTTTSSLNQLSLAVTTGSVGAKGIDALDLFDTPAKAARFVPAGAELAVQWNG